MARDKNTPLKTSKRFALDTSNESELIQKVRDTYHKDVQANEHNTEAEREDMRFVMGDQWDPTVKARREKRKRPTLTINRLPAFVAQYVGSQLQTDTSIKLLPTRGGTKEIAEIRQGLIRTITRTTKAKLAIHKAMESSYICGVGNFALEVVDAENDVFLRDMAIKPLPDPHAVVWDRASIEPTGADAQHCYIFDYMTKEDFGQAYPGHENDSGWFQDEIDSTAMTMNGWEVDEMIRVCQFWQMKREDVTLGLEAETGDVVDVSDWDDERIRAELAIDDDGNPITKETTRPYAECYVMTATSILEGPFRLPISRLPVFRVEGWVLQEASVRYRWGFVRHAKDPQRIHNFWRSTLAEELMKSPAAKWLLDKAGMAPAIIDKFRNAHRDGDNVLTWDSAAGGNKPDYVDPPRMNQAVLTEAEMSVRDIRDVTNRHEASMGQASNEVSGKAISARQRVSELGDVIYVENQNMALAECGKVINELIPTIFDTNRVIKITGEDDQALLQVINGDFGDKTPDITKGKYDLTYSTGPSYATKRQESVDLMMTLMNTMPQMGNVLADIIVRNMDIPGAEEIEERLASLLPPGMIDIERLPPHRQKKVMAKMEAQQEQADQQEQLQMVQFMASLDKMAAEIEELRARASKQEASAMKEVSEVGIQAAKLDIEEDRVDLDAAKIGVSIDQQGKDMFKMGLDAAAQFKAEKDAEAAQAEQQKQGPQPAAE